MFNLARYVPHVEEAQVIGGTLSIASGITAVLGDIPSIHAKKIDVQVGVLTNTADVTLRIYGASKNMFTDVLLGTVLAGNTNMFTYHAGVGQVFNIFLLNTDGAVSGADLTYNVWVGARS